MKNYLYQNNLINKKQLRELLAWSFTTYNSMQSCSLADELKHLGFQYASQAGISISIEDLKIPFIKTILIEKATQEITDAEKVYLKGRITNVERFQKIIDTWNLTSEALKTQIIYYFKNYDPLNSVYIMAFSGARGNLSQVRQLVGMRGLMSDPSGEIMNLPIKKNFREGLTITDYLMSGYGARKGIVDTALKTANSGYLTRRLIDVSQDILIREKNCLANYSIRHFLPLDHTNTNFEKLVGCVLNSSIRDLQTQDLIAKSGTQITPELIQIFKKRKINEFYLRSPLTCNLYRAICQNCYGWDLATENLIDIGEAIGILAGQSIGEPGTQLTMRTFHTGGIFTAATRQQLLSPTNGIVQFYKLLKTAVLRTNRGEEVLVTQNSGFVALIPDNKTSDVIQIEVLPNTILFPKNNQYVLRDAVIGELINTNQQLKTEIKPILSYDDGEVIVPRLKRKINLVNNNKFLWILFGKLFYSPKSAFLNLYSDYKVNKQSYIARSKLIIQYDGNVQLLNNRKSLYRRLINITNLEYACVNSQIKELTSKVNGKSHLLKLSHSNYLISVSSQNISHYLQRTLAGQLGTLISDRFKTPVGGRLFYDNYNLFSKKSTNTVINYFQQVWNLSRYNCLVQHMTLDWLDEEIHDINCTPNCLLVEQGDFISAGSELISGHFSNTSGLVVMNKQKSGLIKNIAIKVGIVYEGTTIQQIAKKIYYPGERLFSNITIKSLAFCEPVISVGKKTEQLLLRPIKLYELPRSSNLNIRSLQSSKISSDFHLQQQKLYTYKSGQLIRAKKNLNLILDILLLKGKKSKNITLNLGIQNQTHENSVHFRTDEKSKLTHYVAPYLKYKNLQSCLLIQKSQFLSRYTILGYIETLTLQKIEIIKLKVKEFGSKQILVISNTDCVTVNKKELPNKKLNDLVTTGTRISHIGKIIIENKRKFTIQKGRPYFFPNCKSMDFTLKAKMQYKFFEGLRLQPSIHSFQNLNVQYFDITKISSIKHSFQILKNSPGINAKIELPKFFLKKNEKLYSCITPKLLKKFQINKFESNDGFQKFIGSSQFEKPLFKKSSKVNQQENQEFEKLHRVNRTILVKTSNLTAKKVISSNYKMRLLEFTEQPFKKSTKAVGLYSITEDYFEQDLNSVFCKNQEFIETGTTIGSLNIEKAITGDIVQGLPKIEEILEARKKNLGLKNIPTSQKKGLLTQITSLNSNFGFQKLGLPITKNNKINPHKLLQIYFNYYGLIKPCLYAQNQKVIYNRIINNYEGSYKSFKKIQLFILHSVQAVYRSQGVTINDKHLEVIIKQMSTKVSITYEGNAPLLRQEVIDLYHINYINKIILAQAKEPAYYVPLLLGITKAALNNPSFISAASFQETTRVLTKAAIEGRIDWLRGLKENIIIGHLIPAGTGSQNYRRGFRKGQFDSYRKSKKLSSIEPRQAA